MCISDVYHVCLRLLCALFDLIDLLALFGVYVGIIVFLIALSCSSLIYSLLDLLIHHAGRMNAIPIIGEDFNAAIGAPQVGDDLT